jgi:hypothetical protein
LNSETFYFLSFQSWKILASVVTKKSNYIHTLFLAVLGFELRVSHLHSRCFTTWGMSPVLFSLVIFQIRSHTFAWGWPWTVILFYLHFPRNWSDRWMPHLACWLRWGPH